MTLYIETKQVVLEHGRIDGLSADDHTQYLNTTRGDARYYTETELNAGQLDTRYFTETEITTNYYNKTQIATISGDLIAQIDPGYISNAEMTVISGDLMAHVALDFIDNSEMTTISGDIVAQITGYTGTIPTVSGSMSVVDGLVTAYTPA